MLQDKKQERELRVMFLFIQILPLIIHLLLPMDEVLEVMPRVLQQERQVQQVQQVQQQQCQDDGLFDLLLQGKLV